MTKRALILMGGLFFLFACSSMDPKIQRLPAAISPAGERFTSETVGLVCAGSATEENTFSFSNEDADLKAQSSEDGKIFVRGRARVRVRSTAERPDFDGALYVQGEVSRFSVATERRRYRLESQVGSGKIYFELIEQGLGRMVARFPGQPDRIFRASCMRNIMEYQNR